MVVEGEGVRVGGGVEPHTTVALQATSGEGGVMGVVEPTLAEEHPSLRTCRLGATMAVTMTLEEEFPLPLTPPPPPPSTRTHTHTPSPQCINICVFRDEWPPNSFHLLPLS